MRPYDPDELIQHAFGELSQERKERVERLLKQNEKARIESLLNARLEEDLKLLRDVPECQLSIDRVRDAIFRSEMRSRYHHFKWAFAAMPVIVLAIYLSLDSGNVDVAKAPAVAPQKSHQLVVQTVPARSAPPELVVPDLKPESSTLLLESKERADASRLRAKIRKDGPSRLPRQEDVGLLADRVVRSHTLGSNSLMRNVMMSNVRIVEDKTISDSEETVSPSPNRSSSVKVILINSFQNSVGARDAKEVRSTEDVLIGG